MIWKKLYRLSFAFILQWSLALADYDCTCNYNVETGVFKTPDDTGTPMGYLYEFDCKPIHGPLSSGYSEIAFEHQIAFVKVGDQVSTQMCQGDLPDSDKVTTKAPTTTTTTTPAPKITTQVPITTTTPKPTTTTTTTPKPTTTTTTTPKPTTTTTTTPKPTTTTTTTPKPTTTTTTTPKPTTTTTTTPKPTTTTTTTPKPTTTTTTTPKPTTTSTTMRTTASTTPIPVTTTRNPKIPEGHVELCPSTTRGDIQRNHGNLQQYGDYCYEFVPYPTQWKNGERHCTIVSNGNLVSIMSQTEQDFILRFLKSHNHTDPVWLGLTDSDAEGTWRWSSGQPVSYKHFQTTFSWHSEHDHKMNDCIVLQSNGEWVDLPCGVPLVLGAGFGEAHSYVCQYSLTSRPTHIFHGALATFIG